MDRRYKEAPRLSAKSRGFWGATYSACVVNYISYINKLPIWKTRADTTHANSVV